MIWIKPVHIVLGILALALLIVLIYFAKRFYDNFYRIQHRWELRRDEKERFREVKKKRYRTYRKDGLTISTNRKMRLKIRRRKIQGLRIV